MENEGGMSAPPSGNAFPRWGVTIAAFVLVALASYSAWAVPERRTGFPCKGCLFVPPPEGAANAPLLVVLHGDAPGGKTPLVARDSEPFMAVAAERGIAVLAPLCPKEEGCLVGSFWQWSKGDPPAWIAAQVDAVRQASSIDPDRIWIAGWSGGASFLGYHYARLGERYAAVIFAGGGMPPVPDACSSCAPPVYFLVGDKNPLHHLARGLKDSVAACTKDITWDLLPGKDHAGEWRALNAKGQVASLVDWLAKHPRSCPGTHENSAAPSPSAWAAPSASSSSAKAIPESSPLANKPSPVATAPPVAHCGCRVAGQTLPATSPSWFAFAVLACVFRRYSSPRVRCRFGSIFCA
jgi:pimeloyl-ACP methyl ester carboxylesterase